MNTPDARIRSAITQVAADWYAAHRAGPLSEAQRAQFLAWLKASPQHVEEYLGVAAMERALRKATDDPALSIEALVDLARSEGSSVVVDFAPPSTSAPASAPAATAAPEKYWRTRAAAAAAAGIVACSALWLMRSPDRPVQADTYRVGHGEQRAWTLADGTTLHVNTDTTVTVRFSPSERLLDIDHGQVLVQVAHDDHRAFRVHAGAADAVAVGTEFDVFRRSDSTAITVLSGQVAVSAGPFAPARGAPATLGGGLRVRAGQRVNVVGGVLPGAAESAPVHEITAWLDHKIVFEQRPLGAVAEEFNRYNRIPFTIDDPALRLVRISGAFDADDTESFAAFLESLDGIRVQRLATRFEVSTARVRHRAALRAS
jgi:transmembrane sensor